MRKLLFRDAAAMIDHVEERAVGARVYAAFEADESFAGCLAAVAHAVVHQIGQCLRQLGLVDSHHRVPRVYIDLDDGIVNGFQEARPELRQIVMEIDSNGRGRLAA